MGPASAAVALLLRIWACKDPVYHSLHGEHLHYRHSYIWGEFKPFFFGLLVSGLALLICFGRRREAVRAWVYYFALALMTFFVKPNVS
jgi:hypothetical protein